MDSEDLTALQVQQLKTAVAHQLRYLNRLCERMNLRGFDPRDPLFVAAEQARHAVQGLHVAIHYCGVGSGVGRAGPMRGPHGSRSASRLR